jgi:hypothetical protein
MMISTNSSGKTITNGMMETVASFATYGGTFTPHESNCSVAEGMVSNGAVALEVGRVM